METEMKVWPRLRMERKNWSWCSVWKREIYNLPLTFDFSTTDLLVLVYGVE